MDTRGPGGGALEEWIKQSPVSRVSLGRGQMNGVGRYDLRGTGAGSTRLGEGAQRLQIGQRPGWSEGGVLEGEQAERRGGGPV